MKTIEVTVTKKNFDAAIAAQKAGKLITRTCLVAQAVGDVVGKVPFDIYNQTAQIGRAGKKKNFNLPRTAQSLIKKFDNLCSDPDGKFKSPAVKKLRASLPVSFKITESTEE